VPPSVNFVEELGARDGAVAAKGVHHPRIGRYGKGPAYNYNDKAQNVKHE